MQCNSCNALFGAEADRNAHYRSDWHRYNLKRKVAGLPGVTEQWFKARCDALATAASVPAAADKRPTGKQADSGASSVADPNHGTPSAGASDSGSVSSSSGLYCAACNKRYGSQSALDNHMRSKLHASRVAAASGAVEGGVSEAGEALSGARKKVTAGKEGRSSSGSVSHEAARQMVERAMAQRAQAEEAEAEEGRRAERNRQHAGSTVREEEGRGEEEENEQDEDEGEWEEVEDEEELAQLAPSQTTSQLVDATTEDSVCAAAAPLSSADLAAHTAGSPADEPAPEGEGESAEEGTIGESLEVTEEEAEQANEWDVSRCLFCEYLSADTAACLEHMHQQHGFFLPDAEFIHDLPGLLQYLAARIILGRLCLFCDPKGRQFPSVAAVRAHMEAKSHAKLRYGDGSGDMEEELADFYDFSSSYEEAGVPVTDLLVSGASVPSPLSLTSGGMELVIRRQGGAASGGAPRSAVIGCREWARYYRQKPRPSEESHGRALATVIARYRALGLATSQPEWRAVQRERRERDATAQGQRRFEQMRSKVGIANDKIYNLPKNVVH